MESEREEQRFKTDFPRIQNHVIQSLPENHLTLRMRFESPTAKDFAVKGL